MAIIKEEMVDPTSLVPHPLNYRRHPTMQQAAASASLHKYGWIDRVLANLRTKHILDGHLRVDQAISNLEALIPVKWIDVDEETELEILAVFDAITAYAEPDLDVLADLLEVVSFEEGDPLADLMEALSMDSGLGSLAEGHADAPPADMDEAEALLKEWGVEAGQLWGLGRHRLMCGDATNKLAVRRVLGGAQPHLCITDPPYGVEYDAEWRQEAAADGHLWYAARRTGKVRNDSQANWEHVWSLFPGDVIYAWHSALHELDVADSLVDAGFELRTQIIWAKDSLAISRGHYHWQHEPLLYAVRKDGRADWDGDRSQSTVWYMGLDPNVTGGHSTQKPLEAMARPMRNHTGDVFEPFAGTGTTILAAENLWRRCYAMEIVPAYCAIILQRWVDATGTQPVMLEAGIAEEEVTDGAQD